MEFLARNRIFKTSDFDEGHLFAEAIWEQHKVFGGAGPFGLRWNHVDLVRTKFDYLEHDHSVDVQTQGPLSDHFRLILNQSGSIRHTFNGRSLVSDASATAFHPPGIDLKLEVRPCKLLFASLSGDFVRSALAQRFRKLPPIEAWNGALPRSSSAQTLMSTGLWLATELDRPDSLLACHGKPRLHAERLLLSLFVECLAQAAPKGIEPALDISERQVRGAEEWIDANVTEAIGVEELATALGVGVRSLQLSFRRVRGYSPLAGITRRRLERAREALLQAEAGATVTMIATQFGFYELGWFSKRYRQNFGENPSQTLARRIGPPIFEAIGTAAPTRKRRLVTAPAASSVPTNGINGCKPYTITKSATPSEALTEDSCKVAGAGKRKGVRNLRGSASSATPAKAVVCNGVP